MGFYRVYFWVFLLLWLNHSIENTSSCFPVITEKNVQNSNDKEESSGPYQSDCLD